MDKAGGHTACKMFRMPSKRGDNRRRCRRWTSHVPLAIALAIAVVSTGIARDPAPASKVARAATAPAPALRVPAIEPVVAAHPGFAVRVIADGRPVADAEVFLGDGTRPVPASARTDHAGVVRFPARAAGAIELWAIGDAKASAVVRIDELAGGPERDVELILERAGSVRGQLVVAGGVPAGAVVELAPLDVDHASRRATVDAEGHFAITGVPYGKWRVEVVAPGHVQPAEQILDVRERGKPIVVPLERAGSVRGTVVDATGQPVAGAMIVLRQQGVQAAPAIEPLPSLIGRHRWVHPLAVRRHLPPNTKTHFGAPRPGSRPAECGRGHCGVDLGWERGMIVHAAADGEVTTVARESRGEAGRFVAIDHGGLRTMYMHLDELRPGLEVGHKIRAGEPLGTIGSTGFVHSIPHLHFALTRERQGRTWYLDPEPMLRYAVVLPAPRPLDAVDPGAPAPPVAPVAEAPPPAPPATLQRFITDARGTFRIDDVEPGAYVAVAFAPELAPGASDAFTVRTGAETGEVAIALRPGVLVHGRVVGRDGPLEGATVIASEGFGETAHKVATTHTDRHGEFALRSLAGKVTLSVTGPRHGEAARTIVLDDRDPHRARRREDFALTIEDARLHGQIVAPEGGTPGVVSLRVLDGPTRRRAVTDAQGRFTIDRVATGRYVVELASPEFPPRRVTLETDRFTELRLEQGGGARLLLRDAHAGAPLAGVRIEARSPAGRVLQRVSDAAGSVELRGLEVGAWTLAVRTRGFAAATRTVTIRPGRALEDVRLELARGATLAGVVRDDRGTRIPGARVWTGAVATRSDADGNFRLLDVPSGAIAVEAEHAGKHGELAVQVAPGEERVTLTVELVD